LFSITWRLKVKKNKKETSFVLAPEASRPSLSLALLSKFPSKTENADGHAHGCAFIGVKADLE
jgi:hypothetical protein